MQADKIRLYDAYLHKMEQALHESEWLVGDRFSMADIAMTPYVNRLAALAMRGLWERGRLPRVEHWFERVRVRPTFRPRSSSGCRRSSRRRCGKTASARGRRSGHCSASADTPHGPRRSHIHRRCARGGRVTPRDAARHCGASDRREHPRRRRALVLRRRVQGGRVSARLDSRRARARALAGRGDRRAVALGPLRSPAARCRRCARACRSFACGFGARGRSRIPRSTGSTTMGCAG